MSRLNSKYQRRNLEEWTALASKVDFWNLDEPDMVQYFKETSYGIS